MTANAVAKKQPTDGAIDLVKHLERSYAAALPKHVTNEQFARALLTSFRKIPELTQCTQGSIGGAVVTAAQLGFMIGLNGSCWLIPYGKECTLIIGYQGYIDLCYRSGLVESITADVVCERDKFTFRQGIDPILDHQPEIRGDRGDFFAVWAAARVKGASQSSFVVLNKNEVMRIKATSKAKNDSAPWKKWPEEMWKKTAIKRLIKLLPKSVDLAHALDFENQQEERWAESEILEDDPFAQGRKSLPSRRPQKEDASEEVVPEPAPEPSTNFKDAYGRLSEAYDERGNEIDDMLQMNGVNKALMDISKDSPEPTEMDIVTRIAAEF